MTAPKFERLTDGLWLVIDQQLGNWIADRIPGFDSAADFGPYVSLGIWDGQSILGAVLYNNWFPRYQSIELTAAASTPSWLRVRSTARALLSYPFEQLAVGRITTFTRASNDRALKLNRMLGFQEEGRVRRGFGDPEDAVIMGLLREDAPAWLQLSGGRHRQVETTGTGPRSDRSGADSDEPADGAL